MLLFVFDGVLLFELATPLLPRLMRLVPLQSNPFIQLFIN